MTMQSNTRAHVLQVSAVKYTTRIRQGRRQILWVAVQNKVDVHSSNQVKDQKSGAKGGGSKIRDEAMTPPWHP